MSGSLVTEMASPRRRPTLAGSSTLASPDAETMVLYVGGVHDATEAPSSSGVLGARPGVPEAAANPDPQTTTVTFDPQRVTVRRAAGVDRGVAGTSASNVRCRAKCATRGTQ